MLSVEKTGKERDKAKMETKPAGESEDCDIKRKKKREGGKYPERFSKDGDEDAVTNGEKKKKKKMKKTCRDEEEARQDAFLDTKTTAPESASETRDTEKVVGMHSEDSGGNVVNEMRRKKRKRKKGKEEDRQVDVVAEADQDDISSTAEEIEESRRDNGDIRERKNEKALENLSVVMTSKERDEAKVESKAAGESDDCDIKRKKKIGGGEHSGKSSKYRDDDAMTDGERTIKEKKKKKMKKTCRGEQETMLDALLDTKTIAPASANEMWDNEKMVETRNEGSDGNDVNEKRRKKRKREKGKKDDGEVDITAEINQGDICSTAEERENSRRDDIKKRKKGKLGQSSEDPNHKKSERRVRFSGHVQVFPSSSDLSDEKHEIEEDNLLRGKRFSQVEDETVKAAVYKYIEMHNLGEEGLQKVLNSKSYPEVKGCWKEIGIAIPYRPYSAVYYRAQVLFRRDEKRKWTEEEREMIRKFHEKHGPKWKLLADELGKHRFHVKDTWRRIKLPNQKKGHWSQEEYQTLFDLVNTDLRLKLSEEKKSKYGMLRDNICWGAISDKLSSRTDANCCLKWYGQLTSPMVTKGEWADVDDYHLIDTLFELDASCIEDVDWDNLLGHRPGEICRKRWNEMVLHIGEHGNKSFAEQVEVLAKRYRPDLVEVREAWDSKPIVP